MKTATKRIKENITETEYKRLMSYTRGNETKRANTKSNLLRAFTILYYTGLRVNELQELRVKNIKELLQNNTTKIILPKTNSERKLYITKDFKRELEKLFDLTIEDEENRVIAKGSNKSKRTGINDITFISMINENLKEILGNGYTSHSFRQGIITEMGSRGINTKIIAKFVGHSDIKTTMRYINPTDEDIVNCLIR
ncbi:site-specific integrase [Sulfurimonas sp.]|uniref:site-specific integrase n=1 Tax=Sulfurimonas sp. TaxID=2022749 RepID=UPI002B495386|nr:site-specific integrase [Sulfurimonas sp.]